MKYGFNSIDRMMMMMILTCKIPSISVSVSSPMHAILLVVHENCVRFKRCRTYMRNIEEEEEEEEDIYLTQKHDNHGNS